MSVYILKAGGSGDALDVIEKQLQPAIPGLKRIGSIDDIGKPSFKSGGGRTFVILVAGSVDKPDLGSLVDVVIGRHRNLFFLVISDDISARDYKQLIQFGNADWAAESGLPREALDILRRVDATPNTVAHPQRPLVVSFVPSAGGVGNSTLAMETAVQLVKRRDDKESRIALVDLDFQTSHVCDYLDITPKVQIDEVIEAPERLDEQLLDVFASRHSSGLDVFAAPRSPLRVRHLGMDALSVLFDRLAQRYAYVLVDLPVSAYEWTVPLLAASEGVLVTGLNTIPGLAQIAETLSVIRAESGIGGDVRVIVNRCEFGLLGGMSRADHVARVLGSEKTMFVRHSKVATECINAGDSMTIVRPSEKAVKDISVIADFCMALKPVQSGRG
jgi:pilus assembly protein CpaE